MLGMKYIFFQALQSQLPKTEIPYFQIKLPQANGMIMEHNLKDRYIEVKTPVPISIVCNI